MLFILSEKKNKDNEESRKDNWFAEEEDEVESNDFQDS